MYTICTLYTQPELATNTLMYMIMYCACVLFTSIADHQVSMIVAVLLCYRVSVLLCICVWIVIVAEVTCLLIVGWAEGDDWISKHILHSLLLLIAISHVIVGALLKQRVEQQKINTILPRVYS